MTANQQLTTLTQLDLPGRITTVGWKLPANLDEIDWIKCGKYLSRVEGALQWWIGDWWVYGTNREYGDGYKLAERVGIDYGTVRTYGSVCRSYEFANRNKNASFSHHQLVANLPVHERTRWLQRTVRDGLSLNQLRHALRPPLGNDGPTELYRHYDKDGRLLYIGISWDAFDRYWFGHRQNAEWAKDVVTITIERFKTRVDAEIAEKNAIKVEKPLYNKTYSLESASCRTN